MAKKRKLKPLDSRARWSSDDEVTALFAWLDHTRKYHQIDFDNTVVAHMKNKFTFQQIEGKIEREWRFSGRDTKLKWREDVYQHGSMCIMFSESQRRDIKALQDDLETEFVRSHFGEVPVRKYRLRSSSVLGSTPKTPGPQRVTPLLEIKETPSQRSNRAISVTPSTVKRQIRDTESASTEKSSGAAKPKTYSKRNVRLFRPYLFAGLTCGNSRALLNIP
jgi:hypothetical protein